MPSRAHLDLDWTSILPLNGSKADAFEELCTQLARALCPPGSRFIRKGRPDSGVEAHAVLADGSDWAWQSKYFDIMRSTQWTQLDKSVETALVGHPKLTRFFACVPLDLADGRARGTKSARQQWDDHVEKWSGWAARAGMHVEFVWQGSHELLVDLAKPEHRGLVSFFFGGRHLEDTWFRARLSEAHRAAGARYTPELNVDLAISEQFSALGRTHEFFDGVRRLARPISGQMRNHPFALIKAPDASLQALITATQTSCDRVLKAFKALVEDPLLPTPLNSLEDALNVAVRCTGDLYSEYRRQRDAAKAAREDDRVAKTTQQDSSDMSHSLRQLHGHLRDALSHVEEFQPFASGHLVLLTGDAGSGKTHLLCDLAKQRLDKGRPTVLLMGQRFLEASDPWVQALHQLDLPGWSSQELVDALEVVAQRADSKVLFIIDAINEGAGRKLWPAHLSAFLERLKESRWISTVISVRSSHVDGLLPETVQDDAISLEHMGFEDAAFDATRAFFEHFGIDLPSSPLLAPEFSNPLYLKTLCRGLQAAGQSRLPRGFHGVVNAFDLYIDGVNKQAATSLDYDGRRNRVADALNAVAGRMVQHQQPWLSLADAEAAVDAQLTGRDYSRSLLAMLFSEGLLIEERAWSSVTDEFVTAVQIGYERMSDYLCVKSLLEQHLKSGPPSETFGAGGALDLEELRATWMRPGFHEALHILVAERTGQELIALVPGLATQHSTVAAFLSSVVWRDPAAITPQTVAQLLGLKASNPTDVVDTLVTLATIPDHPLNAYFTDELLRKDSMAERDAWWTIGLHGYWGQQHAVDRLLEWSNQVWPHTVLSNEAAKLAAYAIAWLLPSSNRYIRDHATKALVRVLTWRPSVIQELIGRFCTLDDAYVVERVVAAAFGAVMRTSDPAGVQAIADSTHAAVFASGRPRPHLLLRDYARGIIKRAEHLCKSKAGNRWPNVDPPYVSDWPKIPTEDELDACVPTWSAVTTRRFGWGHHRIRSSVMDDDFGRYVIGTNSWTTNWLSLRLDEPQWMSFDAQVERAVATLDEDEREAWKLYEGMARQVRLASNRWFLDRRRAAPASTDTEPAREPSDAERTLHKARSLILDRFGPKKAAVFAPLMDERGDRSSTRQPPKFDLSLVQRYVLGRVFELGWTTERFGRFDESLESSGRDAEKPERIGKKYQWIAYHEMLAFMADHYQYAENSRSPEVGSAYQGSWQDDVRDIDPSNVVLRPEHEEDSDPSPQAFGASTRVNDWHVASSPLTWAGIDDIPNPAGLLFSRDEPSCSQWINLHSHFKWTMPRPAYEDGFRDGRREIWMHVDGALVPRADVRKLLDGRIARKLAGGGIHDGALHDIYLGEIGWSEASKFFDDPYYSHLGWAGAVQSDDIQAIAATQGYLRERGGFDCSVGSASISLRVPTEALLDTLQARWSGISATYVDAAGTVVAFDPSANVAGPSALLVRQERLQEVLCASEFVLCWAVQGEKTDQGGAPDWHVNARRSFHGLFTWDGQTLSGAYVFDEIESSSQGDR